MSEFIDVMQKFKAEIVDNGDFLTVSDGFTKEDWDLDFLKYMSPSRIKKLSESGLHFKDKYIDGNEDKDTPSKKKGRLLHWALLEPDQFLKRYIVEPKFEGEGSRKRKKDWHATLRPDAIIMTEDEAVLIVNMIEALARNKYSSALLRNSVPEVKAFAKDPVHKDHLGNPIQWYCILDAYRSGNVVVEIKTTQNGKRRIFEKQCLDLGYHMQTWICRRVVQLITGQTPKVMMIDVENKRPHCVAVNECPEKWFEVGEGYTCDALVTFREGMLTGEWYGYQKKPGVLLLPEYAENVLEEKSFNENF